MRTMQVTIGAGVTRFTTLDINCVQIIVQNNAANTMRVGDQNTTTSIGAKLSAGGTLNLGPHAGNRENLKDWYVAGTQNDVLDVIYTT